jgi:isopenicillin N synthase-like dioxygenase
MEDEVHRMTFDDEWQDPATSATGTSSVPIVDLAPFFSGDPDGRAAVAAAVDAACETHGFLVITGHGVAQESIDAIYSVSEEFFALPLPKRRAGGRTVRRHVRAYCPPGVARYGRDQQNLVEM